MTPEILRQRIKESIDEATKNIEFTGPGMTDANIDKIKHMITQIGYEFYRKGWKECTKAHKKSLELLEEQFLG